MKKLLSCLVSKVKGRTGTCIILRLEVICGQTRSAIEDALPPSQGRKSHPSDAWRKAYIYIHPGNTFERKCKFLALSSLPCQDFTDSVTGSSETQQEGSRGEKKSKPKVMYPILRYMYPNEKVRSG